jgi:hypothetical protein
MRLAAGDHRLSTWEKLLDELTPRQLTVLQAFHRIERSGEERQDIRAAVCTAATAQAFSGKQVDPQKILDVLRPKNKKETVVTPNQAAASMSRLRQKQ